MKRTNSTTPQEIPRNLRRPARPAVEAALDGHSRSKFRRYQRDRDAPEKWDYQLVNKRHPWSGSAHLVLESKRPSRVVRIHHEHEGKQTDFLEDLRLLPPGGSRGRSRCTYAHEDTRE